MVIKGGISIWTKHTTWRMQEWKIARLKYNCNAPSKCIDRCKYWETKKQTICEWMITILRVTKKGYWTQMKPCKFIENNSCNIVVFSNVEVTPKKSGSEIVSAGARIMECSMGFLIMLSNTFCTKKARRMLVTVVLRWDKM